MYNIFTTKMIKDNKFKNKVENKLLNKDQIKWYYKLKGVRFNNFNEIIFIPSRWDIPNKEKEKIWWTSIELDKMKQKVSLESIMYNVEENDS